MNTNLLRAAFWVWVTEIAVSGFNYFVLMNRIYEPRVGVVRAHRIGMSTRIVYICLFAVFLTRFERSYSTLDLVAVGVFWLVLTLVFEWGGSLLIRRPVNEILVGWHVEQGYMWPYVLAAYLLAPLVVGSIVRLYR